ncbi:SLC13 family permease [Kerstersia gyiorum]|uniref:SLC13 family permease n=1 Tax=Kerstersia gyiorum TaxID=206506 RepID=UPI00196A39CD|nr:SLC13 family permease [Kerstersia gyiorum]
MTTLPPPASPPASIPATPGPPPPQRHAAVAIIAAGAVLAGWLAAGPLPADQAIALALAIFSIGLWASSALPEYLTALCFFLLAILLKVAPPTVIFSGFNSSTFWLLFSGLITGAAVRHTALDQRWANSLAALMSQRYGSVIGTIVAFSVALSFVLPSSIGRAVLLIPIITSLAGRLGYAPGSNGRTGMLLATALGTHIPAFTILPANVPNMLMAGTAETLYGYAPTYTQYLLLHFPVLGMLKSLVLAGLILWRFPAGPAHPDGQIRRARTSPTPPQRRLMIALALCLAFWMTDSLHHIAPAWISMAAGTYFLWPGSGLTRKRCINEEINMGSLLFIGGVMGLGAIVAATGLGGALVEAASTYVGLGDGAAWQKVAMLGGIGTLVALFTTLPGVPAIMTPLAASLSDTTGLPIATVLMSQVLAFSNVILPYQSPPLLVAIQLGKIDLRAATRICLALAAVTLLVLTPLDLLWWHLLGWI